MRQTSWQSMPALSTGPWPWPLTTSGKQVLKTEFEWPRASAVHSYEACTHTYTCMHTCSIYTHIPIYVYIHAWCASSKYIAWALLHFKTRTAEPFVEQLVQTTDKESRGFVPVAVVEESTSGLPHKGQWCRYRFHVHIFGGAGINMYTHACPYTYIYIRDMHLAKISRDLYCVSKHWQFNRLTSSLLRLPTKKTEASYHWPL